MNQDASWIPSPGPPSAMRARVEDATGLFNATFVDHSTGLSGCRVWRVAVGDSTRFALKFTPQQLLHERHTFIHRWQSAMHTELGSVVPDLVPWKSTPNATCLFDGDGLWELMDWIPGTPEPGLGSMPPSRLRQVMEGMARLHACSMAWYHTLTPSHGWRQRTIKLAEDPVVHPFAARSSSIEDPHDPWLTPILLDCERNREQRRRQHAWLASRADQARLACWILRDVWRPHVLFMGDRLKGWIDWNAAQIDWPIWDLVRFLSSVLHFEEYASWQQAIEWYQESWESETCYAWRKTLPEHLAPWIIDLDELREVANISILLSIEHWINVCFHANRVSDVSAARTRLVELHRQWSTVTPKARGGGWHHLGD